MTERQVIFKESRYLKRGSVHYYLFDSATYDSPMKLHLDDIMPSLLRLGADGFEVEKTEHPDEYTTLIYFKNKADYDQITQEVSS